MIGGYSVIVSDLLPMAPDGGPLAARLVRPGRAAALAGGGAPVGPEPDLNPIEVLQDAEGGRLIVSPRVYALLREDSLAFYRRRFMVGMEHPLPFDPPRPYLDVTLPSRGRPVGPDA